MNEHNKLADHSGDSNEMVADTNPLSVFAKECVLGAYTYDELPEAARLALKRAKKAEPVQEPVMIVQVDAMGIPEITWDAFEDYDAGRYELYAAPVSAKREWVDLTDDELSAALEVHQVGLSVRIGRIAIAAFKEKNK